MRIAFINLDPHIYYLLAAFFYFVIVLETPQFIIGVFEGQGEIV